MIVTRHTKITTSGTVQIYSTSVNLAQVVIHVNNAGTSWSFKLYDGAVVAATIFGSWIAALPTDGKPIVLPFVSQNGAVGCPLPMSTAFYFTSTGTPGDIDLWTSIFQPSTG